MAADRPQAVNPEFMNSNLNITPNTQKRTVPGAWQSRLVGAEARRLLTPGFNGKVLALLSETIYLAGRGGDILWVAQEGLPAHRRCLLASFPSRSVCSGQRFYVHGPFLQIGEGPIIDLSRAEEWKPSAVGPEKAAPLGIVMDGVRRLLGTLQILDLGEGLGQAVLLISAVADDRDIPVFQNDSLAAQVASPILDMAKACIHRDLARLTLIGRELVGLGPGLTPSGDDFLGGLLFAARSLRYAYPEDFSWDEKPTSDLIAWARTQTHPIGHAILSDLALGHGPEPLHDLVTGLLRDEDWDDVMAALFRLLKIGHTSGGDILAGLLTGMLMVAGKVEKEQRVDLIPKERV